MRQNRRAAPGGQPKAAVPTFWTGGWPGGCSHIFDMSNEELIQRFESGAVPEDCFHHGDHVRLAFAYLSQYPTLQALDKFSSALKRFAAALGKSQLYNETITHAYFFLIRERIARSGSTDWEEF